jgi:hypothetical protein
MEDHLPNRQMPFVWGDFNACGWAPGGDESIYALDKDALAAIPAKDGMAIFVWCEDEPDTILGCVATLEHITLGAFTGWRAVPVGGTFYRGPVPSHLLGGLGA